MNGDTFDALVIGGGINGLSALYHLKRLGAERVGLVERFSIGHDRGSSHGAARVTRSAYVAPEYVRLMQWVHAEEWPRIEKAVGKQLVYSNPGIYTGLPCERLDRYINAVQQVGVDVELISAGEARERFPQFTFVNAESALLDKTGGFVSAKEAVDSLAALARENGVQVHENTIVHGIDPASDPVRVETSAGTLQAERLIVAAGAWARELLPFLKPRLTISRQTVGYFTPASRAGSLPARPFPRLGVYGTGRERSFLRDARIRARRHQGGPAHESRGG